MKYKDIPFLEGFYQCSNTGVVKSLPFTKINRGKEVFNKSVIRKLSKTKNGYLSVKLKHKSYLVHRLVAITWIPNDKNLMEVNHKNGVKTDNRVENLEWVSRSDNQKHAYRIGLNKSVEGIGKWNRGNKYNFGKCRKIKFGEIIFKNAYEASEKTGIKLSTIYQHANNGVKKIKFQYYYE